MIDAVEFSVETNWDESIHEFFDNNYDPRDLVKNIYIYWKWTYNSSGNGYYCEVNKSRELIFDSERWCQQIFIKFNIYT